MVVKHCVLGCLPNECVVGLPALKMLRFWGEKLLRNYLDLMATAEILQLELNNLFSY